MNRSTETLRRLAVLALLSAFLALPACSWWSSKGKPAVAEAIDCAKQDLKQTVKTSGLDVLSEVAGIVLSGGDGWKDTLAQVGAELGRDVLACAVRAARDAFDKDPPAMFSGASPADRAAAYMREQGWTYADTP